MNSATTNQKGAKILFAPLCTFKVRSGALQAEIFPDEGVKSIQPFLSPCGGTFGSQIYKKCPHAIQMLPKGANRVFAPYCISFVWPEHL